MDAAQALAPLKALRDRLAAGPDAPRIADAATVDSLYRSHRLRIMLAITLGYGLSYTCRLTLGMVKKPLIDAGVFTPTEETALEETYYHRLDPPQGFAFQRVYTDDRSLDETCCVQDGDVVMVPRGYHPVGAAHGYDLYYLNVMAGPLRQWMFRNDPAHEWMLRKR